MNIRIKDYFDHPFIKFDPREVKPIESYTQEQISNIKLLSVTSDPTQMARPFGSATYRIQKYPGDLDLQEEFIDCCSINEVVKTFAKRLQKIVTNIKKNKLHYFSEVKAGIDIRYDIDIGIITSGVYIPSFNLIQKIQSMYRKGLLDDEEYNTLSTALSKPNLDGDVYDVVHHILRERKILRWSQEEVLLGTKSLPLGKKIKLSEALKAKSHVKIDMISLINNQFVEVTNFYILIYVDLKKNTLETVNFNFDYLDNNILTKQYDMQIKEEVQKLYYSDMYYSAFKMVKRMWAYSRAFRNMEDVNILLPIVSGNISLLYQIVSELSTIVRLYEVSKSTPETTIDKRLDSLAYKLADVTEIDKESLIHITDIIDSLKNYKGINKAIQINQFVIKPLKRYINALTIDELEEIGFNPPPPRFLPYPLKYAPIVRYPFEDVENPLKQY
ncbi:hypothetical protein [Zamilon virus]|uniref:Uncharacterized protein n=1 Tax=Zamilon virus TaxID=1411887 RepID=V6BPH6_9VIRU|nr:hypothetical protein X812_gp07 [Zamilon virus]CDI70050.1 hypothetical protein [Zamilon virus]